MLFIYIILLNCLNFRYAKFKCRNCHVYHGPGYFLVFIAFVRTTELLAFSMDVWGCSQHPPSWCDGSSRCRWDAKYHTRFFSFFVRYFQFPPERLVGGVIISTLPFSASFFRREGIRPLPPVRESEDDIFAPRDFELSDSSPKEEPVCNTPSSSSARSGLTAEGTACYTDDDDAWPVASEVNFHFFCVFLILESVFRDIGDI